MSATHDAALASLTGEALAPQTRRIRHPRTGRFRAITMATDLWRAVDALACHGQTTPDALCRFALLEHPDAEPADALWQFLWFAYVRPFCSERSEIDQSPKLISQ